MSNACYKLILFVLLPVSASRAAPMLTLETTPSSLIGLKLDQLVKVDVKLSGLTPGDHLDYLAAVVEFDANILGTPNVNRGPIVKQSDGFSAIATEGSADVAYDSDPALGQGITTNGTLYSFNLIVRGLGAGQLVLSAADSMGDTGAGEALPIVTTGASIVFSPRPGDSNGDGIVDFKDLVKLAQNYNAADVSWAEGDFTGEGNVNFSDLVILAQHYGEGGLGAEAPEFAAETVPEPSNVAVGLFLGIICACRRCPVLKRK